MFQAFHAEQKTKDICAPDQEKEGTSLQTQLEACLKYCQEKDYQVARRFSETYSGLTLDRPKLAELRDIVRANDIDVIVVYCLDRLNNLKRLRNADEARLNDLLKTRENITSLANANMKLGQLYDRVLENLQNATPEIKRLALDALDIKVYASSESDGPNIEIRGVIPLESALPTIEQTSA
ncbi:MAG: recombinase family protein [Dehalococcoidales bacterium]|nr:recombinase family protein [Dehalococcoidales bacterium]